MQLLSIFYTKKRKIQYFLLGNTKCSRFRNTCNMRNADKKKEDKDIRNDNSSANTTQNGMNGKKFRGF